METEHYLLRKLADAQWQLEEAQADPLCPGEALRELQQEVERLLAVQRDLVRQRAQPPA